MEKSETNTYIKYFGYTVLFGTMLIMAIILFISDMPNKWLIGPSIFVAGVFNALMLFAISEVLTRLQAIQHNTRVTNDKIELMNKELMKLKESE